MMRAGLCGILVMCLFGPPAASAAADKKAPEKEAPASDVQTKATQFVDLLAAGDFKSAVNEFDATMKEALPEEKLREVWGAIVAQGGAFKKRGGVRVEKDPEYQIVFVRCEFEKAPLDAKVVYNVRKQIAGLFFVPAKDDSSYVLPDYASPGSYREVAVAVGAGGSGLPGALMIPQGPGPFPGLVLVHGSGPLDKDESVGPNKPFLDLASGLASRGIAVLRYDKRTLARAAEVAAHLETLTLEGETILDAAAAVGQLRAMDGIDPSRIFVLGHSLGGVALPRIASRQPTIAGLIMMAAPSRPLEDVYLEQVSRLSPGEGPSPGEARKNLDEIRAKVARVKSLDETGAGQAGELPLGLGRAYWLDLSRNSAPAAAARMIQPLLILQGAKDIQVTSDDLAGWKTALAGRAGVTFKSYPDLSHLFMKSPGKGGLEDYETPGHVAREVVADIERFIKSNPAATPRRSGTDPSAVQPAS
jgi:hypothetical protein